MYGRHPSNTQKQALIFVATLGLASGCSAQLDVHSRSTPLPTGATEVDDGNADGTGEVPDDAGTAANRAGPASADAGQATGGANTKTDQSAQTGIGASTTGASDADGLGGATGGATAGSLGGATGGATAGGTTTGGATTGGTTAGGTTTGGATTGGTSGGATAGGTTTGGATTGGTSGGTTTAGTTTGGTTTGGTTTGGTTTGGTTTGGTTTGGTTTGGTTTGGTTTGGTTTGGTTTGGTTTGGTTTGGTTTGGTTTGGTGGTTTGGTTTGGTTGGSPVVSFLSYQSTFGDIGYISNATGSWVSSTITTLPVFAPSIALDHAGIVHAAYGTDSDDYFRHLYLDGTGTWQSESTGAEDTFNRFESTIAINSTNQVSLFHSGQDYGLAWVSGVFGNWGTDSTFFINSSTVPCSELSQVYDKNDTLYTFSSREDALFQPFHARTFTLPNAGSWSAETEIGAGCATSRAGQVGVDGNLEVYYIYSCEDSSNNWSILYAYGASAASLTTSTLNALTLSTSSGVVRPALMVGSSYVHVLYTDAAGNLIYARSPLAAATWTKQTVDTMLTGQAVTTPMISADATDAAYIAYIVTESTGSHIRYATVDSSGTLSPPTAVMDTSSATMLGYGMAVSP